MHIQAFSIAFDVAKRLVEVTRREIWAGHYHHVKECFALAEEWLREGSSQEKLAIVNVFLYSIATTIDQLGAQRRKIQAMLPPLLKREYLSQVNGLSV